MKILKLAAAVLVLQSTAAVASYNDTELPLAVQMEIKRLVPNADLSNLSPEQALALRNIVSSQDSGAAGFIRAILKNG